MGHSFTSRRPPEAQRCFKSPAVEHLIREIKDFLGHGELAWLFENCFPNTLDTTVFFDAEGPDTFIITGDILAMWLRDSCAQIWPYLPLMKEDQGLDRLVQGTIRRQVHCIHIDPYANAFYQDARMSPWQSDRTNMKPGVHERKWELDSLAWFLRLSYGYWHHTGSTAVFDAAWVKAVRLICTVAEEQMGTERGQYYRFQRVSDIATETLPLSGQGNPGRPCGLVASGFRPSDDACIFPYLIPSNAMMVVNLRHAAELLQILGVEDLAATCNRLAATLGAGIHEWAVADAGDGPVFFYEVDGYGSRVFMDDANIPSLLSLPYLGYVSRNDPTYLRTRQKLWSRANPYFFQSERDDKRPEHEGIGSPHTGPGAIWPLSLMMYALTSDRDDEIKKALRILMSSHAGTGFMHESFSCSRPENFTRSWFGWANSLFGELIVQLYRTQPELLLSFKA